MSDTDIGGDPPSRQPDQGESLAREDTALFPVPPRFSSKVVVDVLDGEGARIIDMPPEPERSPFAEPLPAEQPTPSFADRVSARLQELERRMKAFDGAHTALAEAGSDAIAAASAALDNDRQATEDRLNTKLHGVAEEMRGELDTARGEMRTTVDQLHATMNRVQDDVIGRASRAELEGVSRGLGDLGKTVAAFQTGFTGLRTADERQVLALRLFAEHLSDFSGTITAFKERVGAVERANSDVRDVVNGLDDRGKEADERVNTLTTRVQTVERDVEGLRGTADGMTAAFQEIREAVATAQDASQANHAVALERFTAIEERLSALGRAMSTRASQEEVRRVNESVASLRATADTLTARLEQADATSARHAETLEGLVGKLGNVESNVSGFEHQAVALTEADAALRRRMNEIGEETGGLRSEYDALRLWIGEFTAFRATATKQTARLSSELEAVRGRIDDLTGSVRSTQGAVDAHEGRVGKIEERLAVLDELTGLVERVGALDRKLVSLEGWRRVFAREAEAYAGLLGIAPPPWVAAGAPKAS